MGQTRSLETKIGRTETMEGDFDVFASEVKDDRRALRVATAAAMILHIGLFALHLPQMERPAMAEPKIVPAFPVRPFIMDPPPVEPTSHIPDLETRKVAIPDATPEDPEPIRPATDFEPELYQEESGFIVDFSAIPPPPQPEGPILMTPEVIAPAKIYAPAPQYTEIARKAGTQGVVIVQAVIDIHGQVTSVKLLKGLPMGLDTSALETVKQWRFEAATLNGRPVSVFYTLTINFRLS